MLKPNTLPVCSGLFLLLLFCPVVQTFAQAQADTDYNVAIGLYQQKRYDLAASSFEEYLKQWPSHSRVEPATLYLGQTYINLRNYEKARVVFRQFVVSFSESESRPQALYRVAECSYFMNDYKEAEREFKLFREWRKEDPLFEWALPYYGDTLLQLQKYNESIAQFEEALKLYPKGRLKVDCLFGLAKAYEATDKDAQAKTSLQDILKSDAKARYPEAMLNLGLLEFRNRNYPEAETSFQSLITKHPESAVTPLAQVNRGYCLYALKRYPEAAEQFGALSDNSEFIKTARYWRGMSFKGADQWAEAIEQFETLLTLKPEQAFAQQTQYQLADAYLRLPDSQKAFDLSKQLLEQQPSDALQVRTVEVLIASALAAQQAKQALAILALQNENILQQVKHYPLQVARLQMKKAHQLQEELNTQELEEQQKTQLESEKKQAYQVAAGLLTPLLESDEKDLVAESRYQLARIEHLSNHNKKVVSLLEPLLAQFKELPDYEANFGEAYLLAGQSYLNLADYSKADQLATQFLTWQESQPKTERTSQLQQSALITQGLARLQLENSQNAMQSIDQAIQQFPESPQVQEMLYRSGTLSFDDQNYETAIEKFEQLLSLKISPALKQQALFGLGLATYDDKQFSKAIESLTGFLEGHPDVRTAEKAEAIYLKGLSQLELGQLENALPTFQSGYESLHSVEPGDLTESEVDIRYFAYQCVREQARIHTRQKQLPEADANYQKAVEQLEALPKARQSNLDKLLDEWALLHFTNEQFDQADEIFRKLVKDCPTSDRADDARLALAESDFVIGKLPKAKAEFQALAESEAADENVKRRAYYQLTNLSVETQDWETVLMATKGYLDQFSTPKPGVDYAEELKYRRADALLEQGQLKESAQLIEALFGKTSSKDQMWYPRLFVLKAEIARREKDYAAIEQLITQLQAELPQAEQIVDLNVLHGRALISQAEFAKARTVFQEVLDWKQTDAVDAKVKAQFYTAETYLMQKKYAEAQKGYLRVVLGYPNYAEYRAAALFQTAQCDEVLGQTDKAIDGYKQLLAQYPEDTYAQQAKQRLSLLAKPEQP